jgi:glycosyltransferase involved in cell wall biosynthesis
MSQNRQGVLLLYDSRIWPVKYGDRRRIYELITNLNSEFKFHIITPGIFPKMSNVESFGVDLSFPLDGIGLYRLFKNEAPLVEELHRFPLYLQGKRVLKKLDKRVVIIQGECQPSALMSILLKRRFNLPTVASLHSFHWQERIISEHRNPLWGHIGKWEEKFICETADAVVVVSEQMKRALDKRGVPSAKIYVIPNGTNMRDSIPVNIAKKRLNLEGKDVVVFLGGGFFGLYNLNALSNLFLISKHVLKKNKNVVFLCIGKSPYSGLINSFYFTGFVNELKLYLSSADVAVFPLFESRLKYQGGCHLKVLDYMGCSKPMVLSKQGAEGIPELESYKNCIIANSTKEFADAINQLLTDKKLAQRLGREAKEVVQEKYLWPTIMRKFRELYNNLSKKY